MLAELRAKSQITIPKEIVGKLGLSDGDKLDVFEENGIIYLRPVVVYPRAYVAELKREIETVKAEIKAGDRPTFESIDALFERLDAE